DTDPTNWMHHHHMTLTDLKNDDEPKDDVEGEVALVETNPNQRVTNPRRANANPREDPERTTDSYALRYCRSGQGWCRGQRHSLYHHRWQLDGEKRGCLEYTFL
ncbi:hypothetical protein L195_g029638, partial [Trifolium pratense]